MESPNIAKWLLLIGSGLVVLSFLVWLFTKAGLPLGKLPGDIHVKGEKFGLYFPIMTAIILSIGLTLLINLILYFFRK